MTPKSLTDAFAEKNINAILISTAKESPFHLKFFALEEDRKAIEEIIYNLKPAYILDSFYPAETIYSKGLSIVEGAFDPDFTIRMHIVPKNKFCRFLIKFLSRN